MLTFRSSPIGVSTKSDENPGIVEAIAREVWATCGDDGSLDWTAVERHLRGVVQRARLGAMDRRIARRGAHGRERVKNPGAHARAPGAHANGGSMPHSGQSRARSRST